MTSSIPTLGPAALESPISGQRFVDERARVVCNTSLDHYLRGGEPWSFEVAGPRRKIFFDPASVGVAVVTCGGLCPGLNDVIRGLVFALWHGYGVRRIWGVRHGYLGLTADGDEPVRLDLDAVRDIHHLGGTVLGTSRGPQDPGEIAETLNRMGVGILFCVGGDGTLRGAMKIDEELRARHQTCAVVGIPKTIDNDISLCNRSFGFQTAVEEARKAIAAAHTEAVASPRGVGLVRLMGRHSGFIASTAALSQPDVNACLIPEVNFDLEGPHGLLAFLERRIDERHHAVIVVAEGAGQGYLGSSDAQDASGNAKLKDIGLYLADRIREYFGGGPRAINLKYIDPSYTIRSVAANADDAVYCNLLAHDAAHAGMAGKTGLMVSVWNNQYVHVPIADAVSGRKRVDPLGRLWGYVVESTGQPSFLSPVPLVSPEQPMVAQPC